MNKRITNIKSYGDDYHQAPNVQTRIDLWRSIYGGSAIRIKHIVDGGWPETLIKFDSMLGSRVVDTIATDINTYIEAEEYRGSYALNALVDLT